jgi:two-component system nitrogen regulation sensor histidine kinase NtrY
MPVLASDQDVFDQCTETIIKQVDEIRKMVEEFSEFARMPKLKKTPSDLAALVKEVVSLYQQAHQQFSFNSRIDDDLPVFSFDAIQVKRILINLLDNAIAALDNTGEIAISLEHDKNKASVLLQVADNGVGIAEEVKLRIFEPYYSTRKSGTGLGLAICQTIVSEHGGSIRVADNEPAGTVFTVELPLV